MAIDTNLVSDIPGTRPRYVLPTGASLLANKAMEMMHSHIEGKDYKYDHYPLYLLSAALNDQNTLFITKATDGGILGESEST
jgi:hypothetical protein